jgi:lysophospholipase
MTDDPLRRTYPPGATIGRWHARDGWPLRIFEWPAAAPQPRGSILFQGGRGDIIEKYLEVLHHWHGARWNIVSFDWRGQGGSGRLTQQPNVGDIADYAHYIDDLSAFWSEWSARTPGPHVAMGHSMGGHLILRGLVEGAITPDAAVLVAPMLGLHAPIGPRFGEGVARLMSALGDPVRAAWKSNERPHTRTTRQALLTHDPDRYQDELFWHGEDASLVTGPPSWRWLRQSFASTRALLAEPRLAEMDTPVLMLVADADQLVDPRAALAHAARLPDVRVVRFGSESAHEILREADPVRARAIDEIDGFLAERAPPADTA